jgi:hypothetical protein
MVINEFLRVRTRQVKMIKKALIAVLAAFAFLSCATVPIADNEKSVAKVVDLFNQGQSEKLSDLSQKPFLFDGEILLMQQDLDILYGNLGNAGFKMEDYAIASLDRVDDSSYEKFAETMEVEVYFDKYIESSAVVATIKAKNGTFLLLLDGRKGPYPLIYGFKVM